MARGNNHARSKEHLPSTEGLWNAGDHNHDVHRDHIRTRNDARQKQEAESDMPDWVKENLEKFGKPDTLKKPQSPSRQRHGSR